MYEMRTGDDGRTWTPFIETPNEPRFLLAQMESWESQGNSVKHDVSYADLLVDDGELHLFVAHGQVHSICLRIKEENLKNFYSKVAEERLVGVSV
jgi:hypothetical protein